MPATSEGGDDAPGTRDLAGRGGATGPAQQDQAAGEATRPGPSEPAQDRRGARAAAARAVGIAVAAALPVFLTGALAVQIRGELGFGPAALGAAVAIYFVSSSLASAPMGQVVERLGATRGVGLAATVSAVAMAGVALSGSWGVLVTFLGLAGAGNGIAQPSANLLLADSVDERRLGLAFGIKQSCVPTAALIGGIAVPTVGLLFGWRTAFAGGAVLTAGLALATWRPGRRRARTLRKRAGTLQDSEAPVSSLLILTVGGFLGAGAATSLGAFLVDSGVEAGLGEGTAGWLYAAMSLCAVLSRITLGWAVDRAPHRSRFGLIALLLGLGSIGYALLASGHLVAFVAGGVLAFALGWAWPGLFHYAVVSWYRRSPAAATGFIQAGLSLGASLGPLSLGFIAERASYRAAWLTGGALSLAAAVTILAARRHLRAHRKEPRPDVPPGMARSIPPPPQGTGHTG